MIYKMTEDEVELFLFLRDQILKMSEELESEEMSHTDAASSIMWLKNNIDDTYDRMAKKWKWNLNFQK